ncbi:MAG: hypothetical protein U9N40_05345 [Euryarchaeota archaeon]|nr:hypothetical protein [Euryarchaeota archaeon]
MHDRQNIKILKENLDKKTKDVQDLTLELEKTNEGLIAIYTELDDANIKLINSNKKLKEEEKRLQAYLFETVNKTRNPVIAITRNLSVLEEMTIEKEFNADDIRVIIEVIKANAKMINENISELNRIAIEGSDKVLDHYREFLTE